MIEDTTELHLTPVPGPTRLIPRRRPDGRELLATAKGILIAARGCSDAQAFDELLDVSRRHHMTVLGAAQSLVDLTVGPPPQRRRSNAIRFDEWEQLITQLPPRHHAHAS
jgi:hypothetical protein